MIQLHTPRLHLIAATLELARADAGHRSTLSNLLNATIPADWPPPLNDDDSAGFFVRHLTEHPQAVGWMIWYFIRDDGHSRIAIGNGGFKGEPVNGDVEVGYSVIPQFQRQGYAGEAVGALVDWAFEPPAVNRIIAETFPEIHASRALLGKLGFHQTSGAAEPGALRFEKTRPPE